MTKSTLTLFFAFLQISIFGQCPTLIFTQTHDFNEVVTDITHAGDGSDRIFVVERSGYIRIIDNGTVLSTPFLNISSLTFSQWERGLLGLAFHPDFANNGYFYVNYTDLNYDTVVSRFSVSAMNPNVADSNSEVVLLTAPQPYTNHNGGDIAFGPNDGYLYIAFGDGGSGGDPDNYAQNTQVFLGKLLRIDVDNGSPYNVPANNPFVNDASVLDEIWALGLRNPWRIAFDSSNGDLWIADVGQNNNEEIDFQPASSAGGENYGWRCYEGNDPYNTSGCGSVGNYVFPIHEYYHNNAGGRSLTGGFVYRGNENACLTGFYIYGDYDSGKLWTLKDDGLGGYFNCVLGTEIADITTFGEAENGELFVATLGGEFYEIDCAVALAADILEFKGQVLEAKSKLEWTLANASLDVEQFEIHRSLDGINFEKIGTTANELNQRTFSFIDDAPLSGTNYYRLKSVNLTGEGSFSDIVEVAFLAERNVNVFPNPTLGIFNVTVSDRFTKMISIGVYNAVGALVYEVNLDQDLNNSLEIDFTKESSGVYYLKVNDGLGIVTRKIMLINE